MMEVLALFPAIGSISQYQNLSTGERALYEQFILIKRKEKSLGQL